MEKKEMLEKMFEKLADSWALWKAILVLLRNDELDDETIDNLIGVMETELAKVDDIQSKRKIMKGIEAMKRMKQKEFDEKCEDERRLADLDSLIENI